MSIEQKKDISEILSFVQDHRKKQEEDLLKIWINFRKEQSKKTESYAK